MRKGMMLAVVATALFTLMGGTALARHDFRGDLPNDLRGVDVIDYLRHDWRLKDRPVTDRPITDRPVADRPVTDRPVTDRPCRPDRVHDCRPKDRPHRPCRDHRPHDRPHDCRRPDRPHDRPGDRRPDRAADRPHVLVKDADL